MLNLESNSFTKAQERAISHFQGPCLVLAGPGSGKTKVITHRVAHLIQNQNVSPENILTITFTKAAATEMKERFLKLLPNANSLFCTFHSCFYYILRNSHFHYPQRFITPKEKEHILNTILKSTMKSLDSSFLSQIVNALGLYINQMLQIDKIPEYADINKQEFQIIFDKYQMALKNNHFIDYDMLLLDTYQLLKENVSIRNRWQNQFQYILIDECQDMNLVQYEIIKLLTGKENNLFMVGDDDQSIYRFRGADITLMKRFLEEYHPVREIMLETNFRSTEMIVSHSQKIIQENTDRFDKNIISFSKNQSGVCIKSFTYRDEMYQYVTERFQTAPKNTLSNSAIICRTNAEIRFWGHVLRQNNISYQAREEKTSVFDQPWFLDMEAYLKIGIGTHTLNDVLRIANKPNRNIFRDELMDVKRLPNVLLKDVRSLFEMRPFLAMKYIWNGIGYGNWLKDHTSTLQDGYEEVVEQFKMLQEESKQFYTIEDWLMHIEKDRTKFQSNVSISSSKDGVHLITMHSSKGLEFEYVYIPDLNKGKMPRGFLLSKQTIEEERRLLYVAMTRAKQHLELLYIKGTEDHKLQPSAFIEPILK